MPPLVDPPAAPLPVETTSNGCFETMRAYAGRIFRLDAHLDRLYASAMFLATPIPADRHLLRSRLQQALKRSGLREAVVRIALLPQRNGSCIPSVVVQAVPLPPPSAYQRGIHVVVVPTRKFSVASISPQAKYSARLGSVLAVADAQLRDADEAIFMDALGSVTESTASNIGVIARDALLTPPCWLGLLSGITRDVLFELAGALRIPVHEQPLTRHDCYNAHEAFLTSTIKEILPVTRIDGRAIGAGRPGPVTRKLHQAFRALVRRELELP